MLLCEKWEKLGVRDFISGGERARNIKEEEGKKINFVRNVVRAIRKHLFYV